VKWGDPTFISIPGLSHRTVLKREEFEGLNAWLAAYRGNFFVFPDCIILYGLQGRISPQPWLYFSPGHSFLKSELPAVDARVVKSLKANHVGVVVLEGDSWIQSNELLNEMPQLRAWIYRDFEKVRTFGMFEVWELRSGE